MEQKYYKKTLLIPATSEAEAEQKFQTILKGKEEQKTIFGKWEPFLQAFSAELLKNFIDNYEKETLSKKYK
jgi:hypothetical protein